MINKGLRTEAGRKPLHEDGDVVWRMFWQLLQALEYIHDQSVIHRCGPALGPASGV